jgi:hypothetical protein
MIATVALMALISTAPVEAQAPVQLLPFRCPDLTDDDVRPPLTVELRERLLPASAPFSDDAVAVWTTCDGAEVVLRASRPGFVSPRVRHLPVSSVQGAARARAVALTIAEMVRAVRREPVTPPPEASVAVAPPAERRTPSMVIQEGPTLGAYLKAADTPLIGGWVRLVMAFDRGRPPSPGWSFGAAFELNVAGATIGRATMLQVSNSMAFVARRDGARLVPELGLGLRAGAVRFEGDPLATKKSNVWGGPFSSAALELQVYRSLSIRAACEIGFPIEGPGGYCDGSNGTCATFLGPWALATLGTSVRL